MERADAKRHYNEGASKGNRPSEAASTSRSRGEVQLEEGSTLVDRGMSTIGPQRRGENLGQGAAETGNDILAVQLVVLGNAGDGSVSPMDSRPPRFWNDHPDKTNPGAEVFFYLLISTCAVFRPSNPAKNKGFQRQDGSYWIANVPYE
jgi:hypothetical protein